MYRLFSRIPKGLEPVAEAFRKHVEAEGLALIKEVTEAASAKKEAPGQFLNPSLCKLIGLEPGHIAECKWQNPCSSTESCKEREREMR